MTSPAPRPDGVGEIVRAPREETPTRWQAPAFHGKAAVFRARRLWQDARRGIPVIASEACGLAGVPGVTTIATGDHAAWPAAQARASA